MIGYDLCGVKFYWRARKLYGLAIMAIGATLACEDKVFIAPLIGL